MTTQKSSGQNSHVTDETRGSSRRGFAAMNKNENSVNFGPRELQRPTPLANQSYYDADKTPRSRVASSSFENDDEDFNEESQ